MIAMLTRAIGGSATPDPESELEITGTKLDWAKFTHRTWVVGEGDSISAQRAKDFEDMASKQPTNSTTAASAENNYNINTVPRARKIHQPLLTAPSSSLSCALACVHILLEAEAGFPNVILVNGPATATILVFTAVLLRFFNVRGCHSKGKMRVVYVESWARVKKLSLSGMLLEGVVERFLMQWPQLVEEGKQKKSWWSGGRRREYLGVLV
jgi:beta-1,4-N-acetylglucosaminyltransferase